MTRLTLQQPDAQGFGLAGSSVMVLNPPHTLQGQLQQALPWLGTLLQWMLPLTWLLWAVGVGLMLLLAFGAQGLVRRFGRRAAPVAG